MGPDLTTTLISKHFLDSDEMQKGHIKGQRKGVRSTKVRAPVHMKIEPGTEDSPRLAISKESDIFVSTYKLTNTVHTNQTSTFPMTSLQGYQYIMVGIHLGANYIFCELMKNRMEDEMINAYQHMVDRMKISRLGLKHHQYDNVCSEKLKLCIRRNGMTHKLVPPDNHRRNIAERVIQTFKNHFVSIFSGVNNWFPLSLWCHLVKPAELTVNLLGQSNVTPKVLPYTHVHDQHNYMKCPFAPLG
jgi:hypothetical protein